tara:strand:+ start:8627 stop:9496 length:870 start_codon:yes stop_codon:yes gene_type:complete
MPKRKSISKKQRDALARGRAIRLKNIKNQTGGDQDGITKVVSAKKAATKWKNKSLSSPSGRGWGAQQTRDIRRGAQRASAAASDLAARRIDLRTQQLRAAGSAVSQFAKDRYELKWSKAALAGAQDKLELVEAIRGPIARYLADLGTLGAMAAATGGMLALGPMVLESAILLAVGMGGLAAPVIIAEAVGASVGSMVVAAVPHLVKFQAHYTITAERQARDRMVREITENLTAIDRRNADPETVAVPVAEHYNIPYDGTPAAVAASAVVPAAHRRLLRRNSSSSSDEGY